jgi:phospholipid/cholesterol/gamma-HCH transport system substrate-binding protein
MSNLKGASGQLNGILYESKEEITGTLENAETITASLAENNDKIESILTNTDAFSQQLNEIDLKKTVDELAQTVAALKATINKADQTFAGINSVVGTLKNGEGTLGKLFQDPELYYELSSLSSKADSLINDIQDRPYRYMPLKGRNKIKRYDQKDANLEENN